VTPPATAVVRLAPESVEEVARAVVRLLAEQGPVSSSATLVDARELARHLSVEPKWVREHATELGGEKLSDGPRARWRFDPAVATERFRAGANRGSPAEPLRSASRRHTTRGRESDLLPVKGRR
jgi:hypothetical protein